MFEAELPDLADVHGAPRMGDVVEDFDRIQFVGARLRLGVVDAITAAAGSNRATVTVDGLPIPYDAGYSPTVNDVVYWIEDDQIRVVVGKLA